MKNVIKFALGFFVCSLMAFTSSKSIDTNCEIMHNGTFSYGPENEVKVVIEGENHTEFHNDGKYIIKSKLNWVNDCEYNTTMTEINIPDFPFGVGDVMNVKIDNVEGNEIYYTATIDGQSWSGKFLKMK